MTISPAGPRSPSAGAPMTANAITVTNSQTLMSKVAVPKTKQLVASPLLPDGFKLPASRFVHLSNRLRGLLDSEPCLYGLGVYGPIGRQLVQFYGIKSI